jgi:RNA polymerase sigma factor (sigma-70 family)
VGAVPAPDDVGRHNRLIDLYRSERVDMVRLARLLTGSQVVAEDVVQDAFVRLHPVLDTVDRPGAYLRRTVVNLCRSHHRRQDVEHRWLTRQPSPPADLPPELDETWRLLATLSDVQRHTLVLRFYLDLRIDDIADLLDLPVGTVKSALHRGLAALSREVSP